MAPPARRWPREAKLRDGKRVLIRPISPDDKQGLEFLGPESRYRRFFAPVHHLAARQLRYLTEVDHHTHEALLAIDPQTGAAVGVARFVRSPTDSTVAEVAIAIVDDWQRRGLGTELLHELADRARKEDVQRFSAAVLSGNAPALAVFRDLADAHITAAEQGVVELLMDLPQKGIPQTLGHTMRAAGRGDIRAGTKHPVADR
jgi:RimJ/RimL family protein N-acetyltransferase